MSGDDFDLLWLNVSPRLKWADRPLVNRLSQSTQIAYWEYVQTADEGSSLDQAAVVLAEFLADRPRPVHLIGHGLGGVLGLIYARHYPQQVRSLCLLGVAAQPALTWQAHYYAQRRLIPCSQERILVQMLGRLFGQHLPASVPTLVRALAQDLATTPSPHSIFQIGTLPPGAIAAPLMICGSQTDTIVTLPLLREWIAYFKPGDTLWQAPSGHHFFHYDQPEIIHQQLTKFWRQIDRRQRARCSQKISGPQKLWKPHYSADVHDLGKINRF
jgi:pimeloyl-ACP methyl ester carboxylesterase